MQSQSNTGLQYDKQHAITLVATAEVQEARFVGYDGAHATSAGGLHDAQGVAEFPAAPGRALSIITGYSALVEAAEVLDFGDWVKPAADGSGRAAKGSATDHCGRALGAAAQAGQLLEVQVLDHVHG